MVFSSLNFIFRFMPVFFLLYFIVPFRAKNCVLFLGSIVFYAFGEPKYVLLVLFSIVVNYFMALLMDRLAPRSPGRRFVLFLACLYDVGVLVLFKYTGFIMENVNAVAGTDFPVPHIALPLGISFYTFQIMSYVIDVYRRTCPPERNILDLGTYLVMFPQLIAGPIVVYTDVAERLKERHINLSSVENGLKLFTIGLGEKVIFANTLGNIWSACKEAGYESLSTPFAWLGILAYSLQLYYDFGGYSLMAIGLGQMLGFSFPQNFRYPYSAYSVTDFWHRWHISLTSWFREYVYIPLGGNRRGVFRTYINMLIVWLITGFWHGAAWNFVAWGLYYFVLLSLERAFLHRFFSKHRIVGRFCTLIAVMCGWVLFDAGSLSDAMVYLSRMFTIHGGTDFLPSLQTYWIFLVPACILSFPVAEGFYRKFKKSPVCLVLLFAIFWLSVVLLVDAVYNPFLYFRF
ncbi:MAG: MBOAT family protein [Lachnospiraceae bacterium]|nr:MBOAT family protein [Lachnospiraceae bacterium]